MLSTTRRLQIAASKNRLYSFPTLFRSTVNRRYSQQDQKEDSKATVLKDEIPKIISKHTLNDRNNPTLQMANDIQKYIIMAAFIITVVYYYRLPVEERPIVEKDIKEEKTNTNNYNK
ncbi:hypothetical protein AKO1_013864 [Acrasis kona]|uniref:Uncharacterized protein n=1 Tax=Acrasis kona TaxID=1008807 RepID=A0AAW2ZIE7_9EUKA